MANFQPPVMALAPYRRSRYARTAHNTSADAAMNATNPSWEVAREKMHAEKDFWERLVISCH
ncbi:MAG: hypothetical protein HYR55_11440 [Acidobacteria bacterium]|nr:hypothetical protein [Acidobacteriota bacterium]